MNVYNPSGFVDILAAPVQVNLPGGSKIPEIGLVHFARVTRLIAEAALPAYRTRYSKHTFTQPTLLAVLCVRRYEDWTSCETEVRLAEPQELREALGLSRVPDHTMLYRCLQRVTEEKFTRLLDATVQARPLPPAGGSTVAVEEQGYRRYRLAPSAPSLSIASGIAAPA